MELRWPAIGNGTKENSHQPTTLITGDFGRIRDVAAHTTHNFGAAVTETDEVYVWSALGSSNIDPEVLNPTKSPLTSLDEVFANVPNGALTFRPLRPNPIEEKNAANENPEWLKKSFDDNDTADVVFVVEGKKIHVHKAILIMRCAVFRTMFQGDWKESNQTEQIIEHHSYDVFYAFLRYFYTNEVDLLLDLAFELFALADLYRMTDLQKECLKTVQRVVTVENAAWIYDQAIQLDVEEVKQFVLNFCKKHMNAVVKSDGFKLLKDNVVRDFVLRAAQQDAFQK
ncbi:RCC1 and BTB domain-containing protein 1-like [Cloeon dipterum]|uniref:RCC1 and BTB domain-containing protein 1-like n=1 Tax=Cloeon dipterum TaxID=197152 RepID=UPI00321F9D29